MKPTWRNDPGPSVGTKSRPPRWIKPQLTRLPDEAATGNDWLHEAKYDGHHMRARIDGGEVKRLTRTGLDWSHHHPTHYRSASKRLRVLQVPGLLVAQRREVRTKDQLAVQATGLQTAMRFTHFIERNALSDARPDGARCQ
jgi:hypothetical protein